MPVDPEPRLPRLNAPGRVCTRRLTKPGSGNRWLVERGGSLLKPCASGGRTGRETAILLPNNQRQHRTSHAPKDVLPVRICANYCAPCQDGQYESAMTEAVYPTPAPTPTLPYPTLPYPTLPFPTKPYPALH